MSVSLRELLETGAHLGHLRGRSHPGSHSFVFTIKDGVMLIDLEKTRQKLDEAIEVMKKWRFEGKVILFVGTKLQAKEGVKAAAEVLGYPYVSERWLGGFLTNFETVKKSLDRLSGLEVKMNDSSFSLLPKREQKRISDRHLKMTRTLSGIANLSKLPDALFVVDTFEEKIAVNEANRLGIPVVAILDTRADPSKVTYPIPINDDSKRAVELVVGLIRDALLAGTKKVDTVNKVDKRSRKKSKSTKKRINKSTRHPKTKK